jgi:hypothetical protein
MFLACKLIARDARQGRVRHQLGSLNTQFVHAGLSEVFCIRLQLDRGRRKLRLAVAQCVDSVAQISQHRIDLDEARAHLLRLTLQKSGACFACIAF